jgi:hypothetical protein
MAQRHASGKEGCAGGFAAQQRRERCESIQRHGSITAW